MAEIKKKQNNDNNNNNYNNKTSTEQNPKPVLNFEVRKLHNLQTQDDWGLIINQIYVLQKSKRKS